MLLFVLAAKTYRAFHSGIEVVQQQTTWFADGRINTVAVLAERHPLPFHILPLRVVALRVSMSGPGSDNSNIQLRNLPQGQIAVDLRAPVTPSTWRLSVRRYGRTVVLPFSFTEDTRDDFNDGTPNWMRLHNPADRRSFRRSFTSLAEQVADTPVEKLPTEVSDCASLLRFAYREALRRHDDRWYAQVPPEKSERLDTVQQWTYPNTPLGAAIFRVRPGPFSPEDLHNGAFAQFADAKTLHLYDAYQVSRDLRAALPGDLIFYRVLEQDSQYHSMILSGEQSEWAIYHTGPVHDRQGKRHGELRRVLLADLVHHPDPRWRPVSGNPNFLGVYRWNILREP